MLILARRPGEGITIQVDDNPENDIHIMITSIVGGYAKIGISASEIFNIARDELLEKKEAIFNR